MKESREAHDQLLVDYATEGLDEARWQELQNQRRAQGIPTDRRFEWAAAAIDVAYSHAARAAEAPLPESLRQRVEDQASGFFAGRQAAQTEASKPSQGAGAEVIPFPESDGAPTQPVVPPPISKRSRWTGWSVAVAASLLAIWGWSPRIAQQLAGTPTEIASGPVGEPPQTGNAPTIRRQQLLRQAPQIVQASWTATEDPAAQGVSGDLVWSIELQEGYMLFNGLPVNDPSEWQYQLWIFDRRQDERYPVDGGVFDVGTDGSVVVPIQTQLEIDEPYLFAITIEKPGGVVVSSRERLPLVATL